MSLVFTPKIGEHLRKTVGMQEPFTKAERLECVKLRAEGHSYKECGIIMARGQGSVANAIQYYDLFTAIEDAKDLLDLRRASRNLGGY